MTSRLVDIALHFHAERPLAILVSDDGDRDSAVWLPKSQIKYEKLRREGEIIAVSLPEWLAIEKGLV